MAICTVCHSVFDNVDGKCPECGTEYGIDVGDRSDSDLYSEAWSRIAAGQVADAKGLLTKAIELNNSEAKYHFLLGSVNYKLGFYQDALRAWDTTNRLKPGIDRVEKCLVAARQRISEQHSRGKT